MVKLLANFAGRVTLGFILPVKFSFTEIITLGFHLPVKLKLYC